jgi:uncharacterized membrane protein YoaK (UPF0700 family)
MPIEYARRLTSPDRSTRTNRDLGYGLAFIAGATNAGAFLAVQMYTSHMTGVVATMADALAMRDLGVVATSLGALLSFMLGSMASTVMINFARRRSLRSIFAGPLAVEAVLLLVFGLLGARLMDVRGLFVPMTVMVLCAAMGLQNAVITKISKAEIRTTHMTGVVTDIGIELGKLFYWNPDVDASGDRVIADRDRLGTLSMLLLAFFLGGWLGALGFKVAGFVAVVPLALLLFALAFIPVYDDIRRVIDQTSR